MCSAYRRFLSLAVAGAVALTALGSGSAAARSLKDHKPHKGVTRAHSMPVQGIDVSYWQGDIDWERVREAGIHFAFIKATEGGDHIDPKFRQNWYAAKRAGVARGAYHFIYWCRYASEQADWFVRNVPNDPDALPPVLDLEWHPDSKTCPKKISRSLALKKIKIILEAMERHTGKRPIIYTDPRFHRDILQGEFEDYHSGCGRSRPNRMRNIRAANGPSGSSPQQEACPASPASATATSITGRGRTGISC
ncbi:hypothetical protein AUC68_11345 [Methyloceanibacter methanicus]|uniref:Lysozyme n=1 Tax=Methyloceanibacter methanicus TaxID=1774968 RepID=A0A1E3VX38_9HYPH|nr:hypothetical protein AUC68_11345 [Methyloceanibacter methanicus]